MPWCLQIPRNSSRPIFAASAQVSCGLDLGTKVRYVSKSLQEFENTIQVTKRKRRFIRTLTSRWLTHCYAAPTGSQRMYILSNRTAPVSFIILHGGYMIPKDAEAYGMAFSDENSLTFRGENKFMACRTNEFQQKLNFYEIWWYGGGPVAGVPCVGPLFFSTHSICNAW